MNSYGAHTPVDSANGPDKLRSVARPEKPRHVCPENKVAVLPSRKRAYVEFGELGHFIRASSFVLTL